MADDDDDDSGNEIAVAAVAENPQDSIMPAQKIPESSQLLLLFAHFTHRSMATAQRWRMLAVQHITSQLIQKWQRIDPQGQSE